MTNRKDLARMLVCLGKALCSAMVVVLETGRPKIQLLKEKLVNLKMVAVEDKLINAIKGACPIFVNTKMHLVQIEKFVFSYDLLLSMLTLNLLIISLCYCYYIT